MVETGHLPSWLAMEIRSPCNSSSQTFSTVPAFSVGEHDGFADQFGLRRTVLIQDF
jgi:hypothetical protein